MKIIFNNFKILEIVENIFKSLLNNLKIILPEMMTGKIINQKDLVEALKKRTIAGAALDVFESEPIGKNNPFTKISNITLTPHIGSSTKETRIKMAKITMENLHLGINSKKPKYSVGY